jgi:hypothetical protein
MNWLVKGDVVLLRETKHGQIREFEATITFAEGGFDQQLCSYEECKVRMKTGTFGNFPYQEKPAPVQLVKVIHTDAKPLQGLLLHFGGGILVR